MFFLCFRKLDLMLFNIEDVQIFLQYNLQNPFPTGERPGKNPVQVAMHLWFKQTNEQTNHIPLLVGYLGFLPPPTSAK